MRLFALGALLLARGFAAACPAVPPDPARFAELEQTAHAAFEQRDFARAAATLRQAICYSPGNARAFHELGLAEGASGNFARAEAALSQAERLAPRDFGILLSHAQVQLSLDQPDQARRTLRQARRSVPAASSAAAPALARLDALLGRAYVERKQPDLAIAAFLRVKQVAPPDTETLLLLATLENTQGAYADAIQDALAVHDGGSDIPAARKGAAAAIAGLAYKNQKRPGEAIRLLEQAVQLAPVPTSYLALAEIHETANRLPAAIQVLEQARAALPDSVPVAIALGRNLVNAGEARRALDLLTEATRKDPGNPEGWRWLAEARNSLGQMPAATAALQEIARRVPGYPMIDVMIAQALLKEDPAGYAEAVRTLDRAEKTAPSDPDVYYLRGKIYAAQGRYQDAVAPLLRAIELGPALATAYYQLGLVYQKLGRQTEAAVQFDRFAFFKAAP